MSHSTSPVEFVRLTGHDKKDIVPYRKMSLIILYAVVDNGASPDVS